MTQRGANYTRREALAATMATLGIATAGAGLSCAPVPATKIGCGTVNFRKYPLQEALERIRSAGYEYIETQAVGPWCPHVDVWKDDPTKFRGLVREFGFKGVTLLWALNGAIARNEKSVADVSQTIRWASEAGIPIVSAGDGRKPDEMSDSDALRLIGDRLGPILEVAAKSRVQLAIEPHGTFSTTVEGLMALMNLSDSKWLGINYDTANVHRVTYAAGDTGAYSYAPYGERRDEVATLREVVSRVVHVHLKDVVGATCVPLGQGGVNIRGAIEVLQQHGYTGVLSVETEGDFGAEEAQQLIQDSREYLARVVPEVVVSGRRR